MILSLCVEEIGVNTISFGMKDRKKQCEVMVYIKGSRWMLRFRDNCDAFDPVAYVESIGKKQNPEERFGLRLALFAVHEVVYIRSMNVNNLRIQF